ncbi:MAG: ABC transporter ATP-binding protein [Chloroflexaceae bacterium]|nr:ABC transporter ATP-binding protein [Chloroflexaceae bacterium]
MSFEHVSLSYPTGAGNLAVLKDISFQVAAGEFVALIGPNGCGKTSLLRTTGGLLPLQQGNIRVDDMTPAQARQHRRISFVFQKPVLLPWYTAQQNVALPLSLAGWPRAQRRQMTQTMLQLVGLEAFAQAYPHQLSGGMQQRVALARALSFQPSVLLLDEPFSALDDMTREHLQHELLRIWSNNRTTVLFVTHAVGEAVFLADRILVFSARPGQLLADTLVQLPRPRTLDLLESDSFMQQVAQIRHYLRGVA